MSGEQGEDGHLQGRVAESNVEASGAGAVRLELLLFDLNAQPGCPEPGEEHDRVANAARIPEYQE